MNSKEIVVKGMGLRHNTLTVREQTKGKVALKVSGPQGGFRAFIMVNRDELEKALKEVV